MREIASVRPRRVGNAGLLVTAVAALAMGCGGSSDEDAGGPAAGGTSGDNTGKAVKYAQCMRENGVPSFPDPVNGRISLRVRKGGPLDPENPQYQAAEKACKAFQPPGLGVGASADPRQQAQMLKFVDCMRENGVPNFPDQPGPGIRITAGNGLDPNSPEFKAAMTECQKLLPGGVGPGGQ